MPVYHSSLERDLCVSVAEAHFFPHDFSRILALFLSGRAAGHQALAGASAF